MCNNVLVHNNEFQQQELPARRRIVFNDIHDILMIFMAILMIFIVLMEPRPLMVFKKIGGWETEV